MSSEDHPETGVLIYIEKHHWDEKYLAFLEEVKSLAQERGLKTTSVHPNLWNGVFYRITDKIERMGFGRKHSVKLEFWDQTNEGHVHSRKFRTLCEISVKGKYERDIEEDRVRVREVLDQVASCFDRDKFLILHNPIQEK